jgi:hypothetical protein
LDAITPNALGAGSTRAKPAAFNRRTTPWVTLLPDGLAGLLM